MRKPLFSLLFFVVASSLSYFSSSNALLATCTKSTLYFTPSSQATTRRKRICPVRTPSLELTAMVPTNVGLLDMLHSYEYAVENYGVATDILTSGCINTASDTLAQLREQGGSGAALNSTSTTRRSKFDSVRTLRLATFGLLDGAVSHVWFVGLDGLVGDGQGLVDTLVKTAADTFVYTPVWCAWFLATMAVLESPTVGEVTGRVRSIPEIWREEWGELLRGNIGFFLPITGFIYGLVPRENRVLAFGIASLVYTTILSLWNESRPGKVITYDQSDAGSE